MAIKEAKNAYQVVKQNAKNYLKGLNESQKAARDVARRYRSMYGIRATYHKLKGGASNTVVLNPTGTQAKVVPKENVNVTKEIDLEM